MKSNRNVIEYALIRQEFIAPAFFPIISESILRDDFNFALYLTHGLDIVLGSVFNLSSLSILAALANICVWATITNHLTYVSNVNNSFQSFVVLTNII